MLLLLAAAPAPRAAAPPLPSAQAGNVVTLDPATVYQTMRGWEATAYAAQQFPNFGNFANDVLSRAVDIGINRVRLEIRSGAENSTDNYAVWKAAGSPGSGAAYATWRARRYETINDNGNPGSINPGGYHFTDLDETIDSIVNPLRQKLVARGEALYVNLNYVAFTAEITTGQPYIHDNPAEYAELMLAAFQHLQQKYNWVPNAIEVILEPDNVAQWSNGTVIGQAIVAAGQTLAANGFTPDFVGPSNTCMGNAVGYLDQMLAVANVTTYLKEVSYHRYCQVSTSNLQAIADRARQQGLATSMLEWWSSGNNYDVLHQDLKIGLNSAWQPGALAGNSGVDLLNVSPTSSTVTLGANTAYTQHYFKRVRYGARRIGASSSQPAFDPVAFINADGAYVVVIKATSGGTFSILGLPAGTYGIRYTTSSQEDATHGDQTITSGAALTTNIAAAGVIEVFQYQLIAALPTPTPTPAPTHLPTHLPTHPPTHQSTHPPTPTPAPAPAPTAASSFWRALRARYVAYPSWPEFELDWHMIRTLDTNDDGIIDVILVEMANGDLLILHVRRRR